MYQRKNLLYFVKRGEMIHMVAEINLKKSKKKGYKLHKFLVKNIFNIIFAVILFILVLAIIFPYLYNKSGIYGNIFFTIRLVFSCTIVGAMLGIFFTVGAKVWYEKRVQEIKIRENVKNYSRLMKADMERTSRLFRNKRFTLMKISNVTIMKNWSEAFAHISSKLTTEEMQQLFNYYAQIDKLLDYEKRINKHLEIMQCGTLKDYPYMKEYKDLIQCFTIEIELLFKIDAALLKEKLGKLCSGSF